MQIVCTNDTSDASFLADEQAAVNILDSTFTNNITINLQVGFGDYRGGTLSNQNISEGDVNSSLVVPISYTNLRSDLLAHGQPDFFNGTNLPSGSSINGVSNFYISSSVAAAFGIFENGFDGFIGMGTGFSPGAVRISAFLHEMCHALARVPETILGNASELDLWRFTSAGNHLFSGVNPDNQFSYFSVDNGATGIAQWGQNSDSSDFRNGFPFANDPFNENVGTVGDLTLADIEVMEALGFTSNRRLTAGDDFSGDGIDDFLMLNGSALVDGEYKNGTTTFTTLGGFGPEWQLVGSGDFFEDGKSAGLLHSSGAGGIAVVEIVNGKQSLTSVGGVGNEWSFVGSGNFDGGFGGDDILIRNTSGALVVGSIVNGALTYTRIGGLGSEWSFGGQNGLSADFLGDGNTGFLIHSSGNSALVVGEDNSGTAAYTTIAFVGNEWSYLAAGDFFGDGHQDFLMRNTSGTLAVGEYINGTTTFTNIGGVGSEWQFIGSGNFLNDGKTGVLMHSTGSGSTVELEVANGQANYTKLTGWGNEWHAQA